MSKRRPPSDRPCGDCGEVFAAKYARWCAECRWRHRGNNLRRKWTPEQDEYLRTHYDVRIKSRSTEIAAHFGYDRWVISKRAKDLGLSRVKDPLWTEAQEEFLLAHVGKRTAHWMWAHLPAPRRTETAIIVRLKRSFGSRKITDGRYTMGQLECFFGIGHRTIEQWAKAGHLRVQTRGYRNVDRDAWSVDPADVLAFCREHRELYDLRRVDQPAFLALVFDGAVPHVEPRYPYRSARAQAVA